MGTPTETYVIPDHLNNDTFEGISFTVVYNTVPLDLTGASIAMQLRSKKTSDTAALTLTTENESIVITNPSGGIFQIKKQIISVTTPGLFFYDIQITLQDGTVNTFIEGTWKILQDVTR